MNAIIRKTASVMGVTVLFGRLAGCSTVMESRTLVELGHKAKTLAVESEFLKHDTMYKDWGHMVFSISNYQNPTEADLRKSSQRNWWGIAVELPAEESYRAEKGVGSAWR